MLHVTAACRFVFLQPFEEYCITRKELNELLKKHQKTALELAEEKEAKERWVWLPQTVLKRTLL